jgi:hypothetical protein
VIDRNAGFLYGKTALYVAKYARTRPPRARIAAPADVLVTDARTAPAGRDGADPFAAVYAAQVTVPRSRAKYSVHGGDARGRQAGRRARASSRTIAAARPTSPRSAMTRRSVQTDTVASAGGDVESIDTRRPTSDMHEDSFADVVGKKPVALLFATPQLCQSRVCGPVIDIALQLKSKYGDQIDFIHQEVYTDNDPNKGLRQPLAGSSGSRPEPWLFVVKGRARSRRGSRARSASTRFDQALRTASVSTRARLALRRPRGGAHSALPASAQAHGLVQRDPTCRPGGAVRLGRAAIGLVVSFAGAGGAVADAAAPASRAGAR